MMKVEVLIISTLVFDKQYRVIEKDGWKVVDGKGDKIKLTRTIIGVACNVVEYKNMSANGEYYPAAHKNW